MELFTKTMAVKLRSHLGKYLVADDDRETIRQSRKGGSSINAKWLVEMVQGKDHVVRLKSCHGGYLTPSDVPFLLGMTGKKVLQAVPGDDHCSGDWMLEWEPISDGFQVKLRSWCGKYLRANGGTPPWRNSLTHDDPLTGATQRWILWDVEPVEISGPDQTIQEYLSSMSSFSSVADDVLSALGSEDNNGPSPKATTNTVLALAKSSKLSAHQDDQTSGMDFFRRAKVVRLLSHHGKYLIAEDDELSITQERKGSLLKAHWTVEFVLNSDSIIRLKSCYGTYLTASNQPFLMTGQKVLQTRPKRLDSSVEWEPVRAGSRVRLKTRYGNFLRANGGLPPWRNSVTHDIPQRSATKDWIQWEVDVLELLEQSGGDFEPVTQVDSSGFETNSGEFGTGSDNSGSLNSQEFQARSSFGASTPPPAMLDGRTVYYHIADENGHVEGEEMRGFCLNFKGNTVGELTSILEEETGMRSIVVCSRSPLNKKLVPLRLRLPPNVTMHVIVVPSSVAVATATGLADNSTP